MNFNFNDTINNFLKIVVRCAEENNTNVYFVGGIVRDNILNKPTQDIDLIVDKNAIEFAKKLPSDIKIKSIHQDFYTIKVEYRNLVVDIATTREEFYEYSGALPKIKKIGVDIKKDYLRRDFTVNSMYSKIVFKDELEYELIDFANGLSDIKNKTLRVLHNKSYIDDPTRIIRGVNFKNRFNFDFSCNDKLLIKDYLNNINLEHASVDRIMSVFKYVLKNDKNFKDIVLSKYYKLINNSELTIDFELIDYIKNEFNFQKNEFYMLVLLNEFVEIIKVNDILNSQYSKLKDYELAYYFYKTKDKNVLEYLKIKDIKLNINGNDLIKLGYKQGKNIGNILNKLLISKINSPNSFKNRDDELNWVKNNF